MDSGGAFGGAKAGGDFNPLVFAQRPQVIARAFCLLFAIVIFGCISAQGWYYDQELQKQCCYYNNDAGACNFGAGIAVIAFLAAIGFLAGEFFFERFSSVKTRKHYVMGDMAFSGFWAFLYFVSFCYLTNAWNKTENVGVAAPVSNIQAAIAFSFFSIFTWTGCGYLSLMRLRAGTDGTFGSLGGGPGNIDPMVPDTGYPAYPSAMDAQAGYQEAPFSHQSDPNVGGYQPPPSY